MITYVSEHDVKSSLNMKECIEELRKAFMSYGEGLSDTHPRDRIIVDKNILNTMPGYYAERHLAGLKTYYSGPKGIHFTVLIFNTERPQDLYLIEANALGQIRTGALTAMATSEIVRKKSINFTLIGSGFQAESQFLGMKEMFNLDNAFVYSRNPEHSKKFADIFGIQQAENLEVLKESDVITTITNSNTPIFNYSQLPDEYHINLAGSNFPIRREAAPDVLDKSDVVIVENHDQALKESSEIMGIENKSKIVELKDYIINKEKYSGKKTIFKSMGIGLEDVAAGYVILKNMGFLN
ncbi:MAG: ornithine cyclodeaminase [Ferroplasma sp.]|uniref:ornithine cyclodeaminase n=1 Tax=Ferroplasma sp. TaxID=2591003 RepID=UPI002814AD39|nr:ornithine cyclodeaminase [Ferroplasma sp.]WMT50730.1 MAG: ornithine cyclodeaminase [Ferroplasma sp.]